MVPVSLASISAAFLQGENKSELRGFHVRHRHGHGRTWGNEGSDGLEPCIYVEIYFLLMEIFPGPCKPR